MSSDLLSRLDAAAKGYEAQHGADSRSLFHEAADEIRRLSGIERDVSRLLGLSTDIREIGRDGIGYDRLRGYESVRLDELTKRRSEAAGRLLAAVKGMA